MRMPDLSDESRSREISESTPFLTSSAILAITPSSPPFLTPYGSSLITIALRPPRCSSACARARMTTRPRPERYASLIPSRPRMIAPVGKSGPFTCLESFSTSASGSSISATSASVTSPRLCGGMFVAMPTAIPVEPLTSRFGKREGSTCGSLRDSS